MTPVIERLALRHAAALVEYYRLDKIAAKKTLDIEKAELHAACQAFSQEKK